MRKLLFAFAWPVPEPPLNATAGPSASSNPLPLGATWRPRPHDVARKGTCKSCGPFATWRRLSLDSAREVPIPGGI